MLFILNNFKYITTSFVSSTSMKLKKKKCQEITEEEELNERMKGYSNMGAKRLDEEVIFYIDLKEEMQFPQAGKGEGDAFFQTRSYLV